MIEALREPSPSLFNRIYVIIKINFVFFFLDIIVVVFVLVVILFTAQNKCSWLSIVGCAITTEKKEMGFVAKEKETQLNSVQWKIYVGKLWKKLNKKYKVSSVCRVMNSQEKPTKMKIVYVQAIKIERANVKIHINYCYNSHLYALFTCFVFACHSLSYYPKCSPLKRFVYAAIILDSQFFFTTTFSVVCVCIFFIQCALFQFFLFPFSFRRQWYKGT